MWSNASHQDDVDRLTTDYKSLLDETRRSYQMALAAKDQTITLLSEQVMELQKTLLAITTSAPYSARFPNPRPRVVGDRVEDPPPAPRLSPGAIRTHTYENKVVRGEFQGLEAEAKAVEEAFRVSTAGPALGLVTPLPEHFNEKAVTPKDREDEIRKLSAEGAARLEDALNKVQL
jgi:hypothetical protein